MKEIFINMKNPFKKKRRYYEKKSITNNMTLILLLIIDFFLYFMEKNFMAKNLISFSEK